MKCRFVAQFPAGKLAGRGKLFFEEDARASESSLRCRENEVLRRQPLSCSGKFRGVKRPVVYETGETQFLAFVMSVIVGGTTVPAPLFFLAEIGLSELARNGTYSLVS